MPNLLGIRSELTPLQRAIIWWAIDNDSYRSQWHSWSMDDSDLPSRIWLGSAEKVIDTINEAEKVQRGLNEDAKRLREILRQHVAKNKRSGRENAV